MRICSHTVAAAVDNGDLQEFVNWFIRSKKSPNVTKLVTARMPKGCGRKGCTSPRKCRKKVTLSSRKSLADILKEQAPKRMSKECSPSNSPVEDKDNSGSDFTNSQYSQSAFGGCLTITGNEESMSVGIYTGDVQLESSSLVGAEEHRHIQHGGSVVLTHTSHWSEY